MEESNASNLGSFRDRVAKEKQKFWEMEGNRVPISSDPSAPIQANNSRSQGKKSGNVVLFIITFIITVAITAYILINFFG